MIVSAAVMATAHARSAAGTILAVLVTLTVYWAAERYARLVAERIHRGHRLDWHQVRRQLTAGWEIVTTSALPLVVLLVLRLLGAELTAAVSWALVCSTLLLCLAGWEIGRHGQLTGLERLASAVTAGMFGVLMVLLKALLH